jgi:hypothetical protein
MLDSVSESLQDAVDRVVASESLITQLRARVRRRLYTTLSHAPQLVDSIDPEFELRVALFLGVHRARLDRFMQAKGWGRERLRELRKQHNIPGRRRQHDTMLMAKHYPELTTFLCSPPLSDEEVLKAAEKEFRDAVAGPGSDYADEVRFPQVITWAGDSPFQQHQPLLVSDTEPLSTETGEEHPLGPAFSRAASIALELYGQSALYWLAQQLCYSSTEYTALLKDLGGIGKDDLKTHWFYLNGLTRKMPKMNERIVDALRKDPLMKEFYEERFGPLVSTPPVPVRPITPSIPHEERTKYFERLERRFRSRLVEDGHRELDQHHSQLPAVTRESVLRRYASAERSPVQWGQLVKALYKEMPAADAAA